MKFCKEDFWELVNGGLLEVVGDIEKVNDWGLIVDCLLLMICLEDGYEDGIKFFVLSEVDFNCNKEELFVEVLMFVVIVEVFVWEGMLDVEEEGYVEYVVEMCEVVLVIVVVIELNNYD